jgi:hypothetical protein
MAGNRTLYAMQCISRRTEIVSRECKEQISTYIRVRAGSWNSHFYQTPKCFLENLYKGFFGEKLLPGVSQL